MNPPLPTEDFWNTFVEVMRNPPIADFGDYYNNAKDKYRARNVRPRTDAMLKRQDGVLHAVLDCLKGKELLPAGGAISLDRYIDLSYAVGNWWDGEKDYLIAAEVENAWHELRGTLLTLVRFQCRLKVAVFYAAEPRQQKGEMQNALGDVINNFHSQGLEEAANTNYLLIIAPDGYHHSESAESAYCVAFSFTGLHATEQGRWLEEKLW